MSETLTKGGKMAAIVDSIDISRRPEDVFSYATDLSRYPEWQPDVVSARKEGDGPPAVGSRAAVIRRVGPRKLQSTQEITELNPPRTWTVRAVGGPIIAFAKGTIESLGDGQRSRVTIALEFEGRGIGRLLVPLVIRRQGRKALPRNEQRLKELLEAPGGIV
jgi:uncharacterized protein YndB with AHSA1/START domain